MLFQKAFILCGVFWLFFRLRFASAYSERSARIVSLIWAAIVLLVVIMLKGFTFAALGLAGGKILIATCIFYSVAFLDNTVLGVAAWPLGFLAVLFFG